MNSEKGIGGLALVVILAVVVVAGGAIFYLSSNTSDPQVTQEDAVMQDEGSMTDDSMTEEEGMTGEGDMMAEDSVTIDITAQNFDFSQDTITVKKGQEVTINLESAGGFHDWVVDEFDVATAQVNTGEASSVTFVAGEVGEFEYYCSVGNHRQMGMVGTLVVEE